MLREDQIRRYARQILLREVGGAGQARLLAGRVVVGGVGVAAEEAATYLAAAGVGAVVLDDALAARAGDRLRRMNPDARVDRASEAATQFTVSSAGAPVTRITPEPEDDRLAGALAAHAALMTLTGAASGFAWTAAADVLPPTPTPKVAS